METVIQDTPRPERLFLFITKQQRLVGRVSMDMLYVDLSKIEKADIGSKVEMWGNHISVDDVAKNSGTVGYELLCNVSASSRVPLEYDRWPKVKQLISAESVAELHLNGKDSAHIVLFGILSMRQLLNQRRLQGLLRYQRLMSLQSLDDVKALSIPKEKNKYLRI